MPTSETRQSSAAWQNTRIVQEKAGGAQQKERQGCKTESIQFDARLWVISRAVSESNSEQSRVLHLHSEFNSTAGWGSAYLAKSLIQPGPWLHKNTTHEKTQRCFHRQSKQRWSWPEPDSLECDFKGSLLVYLGPNQGTKSGWRRPGVWNQIVYQAQEQGPPDGVEE